jgi:hypothetical protein
MATLILDKIVALLNEHQQRATYGAVAEVVGAGAARGLMQGRTMSREDSWVVAKKSDRKSGARRGWPTGYPDDQIHPECLRQIRADPGGFIGDADELRRWVERKASRRSQNQGER